MYWLILIPVFYFFYKVVGNKKDTSVFDDDKKPEFKPAPPLVRDNTLGKGQKPEFKPAPSLMRDNTLDKGQKPEFKPAPARFNVDQNIWKYVKLFLFCKKIGAFANRSLFKVLSPFMGISQDYSLVPKKVIKSNLSISYNDPVRLEKYVRLYNSKLVFAPVPYLDDEEASYVLKDVLYYVDVNFDLSPVNKKFVKSLDFFVTDNVYLLYGIFSKCYDSYRLNVKGVVSNDVNLLNVSRLLGVPLLNYEFFKAEKKKKDSNFLGDIVEFVGDVFSYVLPDAIEKKISYLQKKFGSELRVYAFTGGNYSLSVLTYIGKKVMGEGQFVNFASTLYGVAGAIVATVFTGVGGVPAYKLTKAQAKYVLTGDYKTSTKEIVDWSDIRSYMEQLSSDIPDGQDDFDSISFTEYEVNA